MGEINRQTDRYVRDTEAAGILGLGVSTLRNYRHLGKGPAFCRAGRAVRYSIRDLDTFMRRERVEPST